MRMLCSPGEARPWPHAVPLPRPVCMLALADVNMQQWWRPRFKSGEAEALKAEGQSQDRRAHPWALNC